MPVSMSNQQPQPFVLKPVDFLPAPIPALLQKTQIFAYRLPGQYITQRQDNPFLNTMIRYRILK